ncbi:MAG: HD-GYP domain-containing protein [Paludibacterium sp.]|uniref:HD-GYP domain-containing protein n=1 Tax=Paludibacterium sp. TaxID=1917523 RepID=UPI0025FB1892|nr:HD-GYP domain-containing protein [Paludibacterium sp.]MBV8048153.1 HD-GYP domain-containing protein [Paludibacterium sp.]MBV8648119.1 HD-GYP domain-containing protein [Paludibacterium sp.]
MISYRHLDYLLHPHRLNVHRALLKRLVPMWLLLSLAASITAWQFETGRIDQWVRNLSTDAVQQFRQTSVPELWRQSPGTLQSRLDQLLPRTPFVGVSLFDPALRPLGASWRGPAIRPADWPPLRAPSQRTVRIGERIYVQSLVALQNSYGQTQGYFQAIYLVPPETAQAIAQRIRDTLIGVLLVVAMSSLAIYPVVVSLNRDTVRLSHNLLDSNVELLRVLGSAIAKRDADTDSHNYRVTLYAVALAEALGRTPRDVIALMAGAFLHDVGKIGIADRVLLKPGALDDEEFALMKQHVDIGVQIIGEVKWLEWTEEVVGGHHERYDGSGYPRGLRGDAIPYNARLFTIVDVFDALTSRRPYKEPFALEQTLAMMQDARGRQFDPAMLDVFLPMAPRLYDHYHAAQTDTLKHLLAQAMRKYFRAGAKH